MPLHPAIVHLPLALTFVLPALILVFIWAIRSGKMSREMWVVIVGLQLLITASGYLALETGETDEDKVAKVAGIVLVQTHEQTAEIFVGTTVVSLAVGVVAIFLQAQFQLYARLAVLVLSLLSCVFAFKTGEIGGEIVYAQNGASVHAAGSTVTIREHTGVESGPEAEPDNESLKADENDYSGENLSEDEQLKSED